MPDRFRKTASWQPASETYVHFNRRGRIAWQIAWVSVMLVLLGACVAGIPAKIRDMQVPAVDEAESVSQHRLLPAEHEALLDLGISVKAYIITLESIALLVVVAAITIAALIYWKRRDSRVAWVVSVYLVVVVATTATFNVDSLVLEIPALSPLAQLQGALQFFLPVLLFFIFPNGRFTPGWSRWLVLAWGLFVAAQAVLPDVLGKLGERTDVLAYALTAALLIVGVVAQIQRYRKTSTPNERQQTKWVVVVLALQAVAVVIITVSMQAYSGFLESPLATVAWESGMFLVYEALFLLLLVAFLFAILRYRLWDIDFLINRSLVYGALTLLLVLTFGISVLALRQGMLLITDGQNLPIVLGTALLAVGLLFQPTRKFLHKAVNKRLYGIGIDILSGRSGGPEDLSLASMQRQLKLEEMELIGRGGMADVYRARDPERDRLLAVKVMHDDLAADSPEYVKRFEREAQIIAALEHDNIVRMQAFGTLDNGIQYIVMEYIDGVDLADYLYEMEVAPFDRGIEILRGMGDALDYAHGKGIVHRDIKPSNVLLEPLETVGADQRFRAVFSDFGIAKISSAATKLTSTNVVGTIHYVSPEQIRDSAEVDGRSDVYSMGVLIFQMFAGRRPFEKNSAVAMMLAHLQQPPPDPREFNPQIPPHVAHGILKALAKSPAQRQATVGELVTDLDRHAGASGGA